ncbi:interferon lambda-2-like [Mauremys reevesii]|uniref:interferon lambda-2-like n=1 Tax=Mauremys reevesii TaxID=260615 RepID=UPI00193F9505|nr:interferon lambda-2-like [Mauremys reevesii]
MPNSRCGQLKTEAATELPLLRKRVCQPSSTRTAPTVHGGRKMVNVSYKVLFALAIWTITEAFPKGAERTKCHLAQYKSLPPRELEAFKKAKDKFVHDRVILVEKELDFATNVLENVEDPSLSKLLSRPLEILTQIRGDLRDCTRQTHSHRHSRRLNNWLQNFHESKETETPGCLEASVILNLFRLLNEDLRCAAYTELCV